ncbi:hypothetical protein [Nostoc sp. ATCC 53789]|uniref:hypothetical protein n=1 Tax=Nostoc sp. ATCC 53789 TaxID=76335 RepID=UPI000DEC111D|nr:hypothetical protein [Nostoc sp. ATCC 53789]QHG17537.1 hypothetical protein GJB62_17125 [Nostoc sp. ATCC 53789]RCJ30178.1 hypothetical protein A6V25_15375 [Nostoc sp. ATCC 53789]
MFENVIHYIIKDIFYQAETVSSISNLAEKAVEILDAVPSISHCHDRDFKWSRPIFILKDGTLVKTCKNVIGLDHIFLADSNNKLIYGSFVDWRYSAELKTAIIRIKKELA